MKHLLRLAAVAAVALTIGGCAQLQSFADKVKTTYDAVTSVQVTATEVSIAGNAFDAAESTASAYLKYCRGRLDGVCGQSNKDAVVKAVYSGRVARNRLKACVRKGNCGAGSSADYSALKAATDSVTGIVNIWKGS